MVNRIEFTVTGEEKLHCSGCEMRVRFTLERTPGVEHVAADAKTQRVAVMFDPALLTADHIRKRLKEIGFDVEVSS